MVDVIDPPQCNTYQKFDMVYSKKHSSTIDCSMHGCMRMNGLPDLRSSFGFTDCLCRIQPDNFVSAELKRRSFWSHLDESLVALRSEDEFQCAPGDLMDNLKGLHIIDIS